jgi:seryl-tRNA synthetase
VGIFAIKAYNESMLDIRFIRENPKQVQQNAINKGYSDVSIDELLELDYDRRVLQQQVDELRERRNQNAAKMKGGKPEQAVIDEGKQIKVELADRENLLRETEENYLALLKKVPNMAWEDVPVGLSEDENVVVKVVGEKPEFDFEPQNHEVLAIKKGWLDKERAAKVAGARFVYLLGDVVFLQQAIVQFVMNSLSSEETLREIAEFAGLTVASEEEVLSGKQDVFKIQNAAFIPVLPPLMIRTEPYDQMDRLEPRDDRYKIEGEELWLQGSAEHVLGSMHQGERFSSLQLPIRYLGYATSFRKEAGTYGKDMEGIIRMHQFDKLEMESFTTAEASYQEHLFMIGIQEWLLQQLQLPYRVLQKCTADIGKPNARGVDMEVWIPSQQQYRETHTADYMTDYQTRRLGITYRPSVPSDGKMHDTQPPRLAHTNDATAFALGRCMIAIVENYQTAEGDVIVPEVLRPYMGGRGRI